MREPKVGDVVIYRPDKRHQAFHDKGFESELPAIVTKVWEDGVANVRVCPKVDLRVLLDSSCNPPFVFGSRYGQDIDEWHWPEDSLACPKT